MACQLNRSINAPPGNGAQVITSATNEIMRENLSLLNISHIRALITARATATAGQQNDAVHQHTGSPGQGKQESTEQDHQITPYAVGPRAVHPLTAEKT